VTRQSDLSTTVNKLLTQPTLSAVAYTQQHTHTQTQPFYGSVEFVRDNPGRVLTNSGKLNSLSFPGFPDPLISLFQTNIK